MPLRQAPDLLLTSRQTPAVTKQSTRRTRRPLHNIPDFYPTAPPVASAAVQTE